MPTVAKKAAKEVAAVLDAAVLARYGSLSLDDIRALVIEDKWGAETGRRICGELATIMQGLIDRIVTLSGRYGDTLSVLEARVEKLGASVMRHLASMGVE